MFPESAGTAVCGWQHAVPDQSPAATPSDGPPCARPPAKLILNLGLKDRNTFGFDVNAELAYEITAPEQIPELISEIATRFGSQVLVLSVDARRARTDSGFEVTTHGGRESAGVDALAWVEKACALGVGEILLNSMDADGTRAGYDIGMITAVRAVSNVPLIASGGAGTLEDFASALDAGADALLAASVFHFGIHRIGDVKKYLSSHNYSVRNAHTV